MSDLRKNVAESYRSSMKEKKIIAVSTLRLIMAALKDRDIAVRGKGNPDGIEDGEILQMLRSMIRERRESISLYEQGCRIDLAQREQEEIYVIERFLPVLLNEAETKQAVEEAISRCSAEKLKDMGRVMTHLRERFPGRIDMTEASAVVKSRLC